MLIFLPMEARKCVLRWRNSTVIPMKPFSQWLSHVDEISIDAALHGLLAFSCGDFSRISGAQQLAPHPVLRPTGTASGVAVSACERKRLARETVGFAFC